MGHAPVRARRRPARHQLPQEAATRPGPIDELPGVYQADNGAPGLPLRNCAWQESNLRNVPARGLGAWVEVGGTGSATSPLHPVRAMSLMPPRGRRDAVPARALAPEDYECRGQHERAGCRGDGVEQNVSGHRITRPILHFDLSGINPNGHLAAPSSTSRLERGRGKGRGLRPTPDFTVLGRGVSRPAAPA
jgi:hypothetical protein